MADNSVLDYEGAQYLVAKLLTEIHNSIPAGIIMMWSGATNNIPTGWALCNGQNGTPNLQGRFVLGASSDHPVGQTGGAETHTITVSEMPAHTHTTSGISETTSTLGGSLFSGGDNLISPVENANTGSTGNGSAMSLMPPYYALAYIMKLAS